MYKLFFRLVLCRLPTEWTHRVAFFLLRTGMRIPGISALSRRLCVPRATALRVHAMGLDFPSPLGLAAGFDKNAIGYEALGNLGFGFVEIGTVTSEAQPGNAKPRMFRLPGDRALINRMGFNNAGAAVAARRLSRKRNLIVGGNIGKTKRVAEADAVADYVASAECLAPVCDYIAVNVSSPNTPGLRDLQSVSKLEPILRAVRHALETSVPTRRIPLLVKIAPDLADEDIDAVAKLALTLRLDGIIATNTTIGRENLSTPAAAVQRIGAGGLSGAPLKDRALEVLARLHQTTAGRLTLIAAGGIETAEDAHARLQAGASLVQAYTAFVYEGPLWPRRINRRLATLLSEAPAV